MRPHRMAHIAAAALLTLFGGTGMVAATARADSAQDQLIDLPGGAIHIVTSGVPDAHAVVLIHGLGASASWWDPVMPALDGKYVVRVDLLGHGQSAKPASGYSIPEQAARVGTILDRLGVTRATVIGHSSGGYVATSLAEQRRPLVSALGLIDSGPRLDAFTDNGPVGELLFNPAIGQPLWPILPDAAVRMAMSSAFTRNVQIPDRWVSDLHGMTYRSVTATSAASDDYLTERPEPVRLTDLVLPTLVIYGTRDRRWQPSSFDDYRQVPATRIEPLDCGHTPMAEDPDHTGALLRDFVDEH